MYITDRKKDLIIKGGENISPSEIEQVLYLHPAIAETAVVGIPDDDFGEQICAVIQLRPEATATEDEIREHAAMYIGKFKRTGLRCVPGCDAEDFDRKSNKQLLRGQLAGIKETQLLHAE